MEKTREETQMDALLRGSKGVEVAPGLTLYPVSFGSIMALNKLGNSLVHNFVNGEELKMSDFEDVAEFFWAHTRPWEQVHASVLQFITQGTRTHIDSEVLQLAGLLTTGNVEVLMRQLMGMQKEATNAQVEIIPDPRHKDSDAPKN